jgi:DNA-binding NtrC family response regulator
VAGPEFQRSRDVLVVEDDDSTRQLLSIALERRHLHVMVAENGVEAIRLLDIREFCAVVLDLVLPKVDGYGVIRHIKEDRPKLPIIVITGLKPEDLSAIDRSAVVDVIFKPLDIEKLADRVQELCDADR